MFALVYTAGFICGQLQDTHDNPRGPIRMHPQHVFSGVVTSLVIAVAMACRTRGGMHTTRISTDYLGVSAFSVPMQ